MIICMGRAGCDNARAIVFRNNNEIWRFLTFFFLVCRHEKPALSMPLREYKTYFIKRRLNSFKEMVDVTETS